MKIARLFILLAILMPLAAYGQTVQTPSVLPGSITFTSQFTAGSPSSNCISLVGSGISSHVFMWTATGNVTGGQVKLQSATDSTCASGQADLIAAQVVTATGTASAVSGNVNYVRFTTTVAITGTGTVSLRYFGFVPSPAAGSVTVSGNINVQGPAANGAAASGNPVQLGIVDASGNIQRVPQVTSGASALFAGVPAVGPHMFLNASTYGPLCGVANLRDGQNGNCGLITSPELYNGTSYDAARSAGIGNNVAATGIPAVVGYVQYNTATQTPTPANYMAAQADSRGNMLVSLDHVNRFTCVVTVSTQTTIQAVGNSCVAPGAGLSLYITDINVSASAAGIAADAFPTLKSGTGGTCGVATAVVWGVLSAAAVVGVNQNFATPIKLPANNELCWITTTAGSKFWTINGYIAP